MNDKVYANYLMHGRTKGSRNGVSTTKGYTAVGQKAKGKLVNGKYVYANNNENTQSGIVVKPTSNNWQQQAALEQWKKQNRNNIAAKKKKAEAFDKASDAYRLGFSYPVDQMANRTRTVNEHYNKNWKNNTTINYDSPGSGAYLDAKKAKDAAYLRGKNAVNKAAMNGTNTNAAQAADLARWAQQNRNNIAAKKTADAAWKAKAQGASNNWQQQANAYRSADETLNKFVSGKSNDAMTTAKKRNGSNADKAAWTKYASAKGAANDWQNQANAQRAMKEYMNKASDERKAKAQAVKGNATWMGLRNKVKVGAANNWQQNANKTAGILGNMSREDRSLMKSKEWTSTDKDGTKKTNNSFNVNNKYGYRNYTKSDNGWHDVHMGEYNTTGVKGVKKQQDWNTSYERNHRSDIGNAVADAKADAKKAFKEAKADAKQAYVNLKNKFKKKKKK